MKAIVFVKKSERLPGKHSMDICGKKMIQMVCEPLIANERLDEVIIYSKDPSLRCDSCKISMDNSAGVLIDSLIAAIKEYGTFLAVGGDMPFINDHIINLILNEYVGIPIAMISSEGIVEPLFAVYNRNILKEFSEYSSISKSIYPFISRKFKLLRAGKLSSSLMSINTNDDLEEARKLLGCY